jgi:CRISPR-associated protein Cas1
MHVGSDGSSKFIFDLMEPERPKVDRKVLDFVKNHVLDPADFVIRTDAVGGGLGSGASVSSASAVI